MSSYDQVELDELFVKCRQVLGDKVYEDVVNSPPRWSGFATSLEAYIKFNNNDLSKIKGALEVALEIWPYEAEAVAKHFYKGEVS